MAGAPKWWFNKVDMPATFKQTTVTTKHGEHQRFFYAGKRVTEGEYLNRYKGALYQNQVRGWAMKAGVTDWNTAQSKFTKIRNEYRRRKDEAVKDAKGDQPGKPGKDEDIDLDAIWDQVAYDKF